MSEPAKIASRPTSGSTPNRLLGTLHAWLKQGRFDAIKAQQRSLESALALHKQAKSPQAVLDEVLAFDALTHDKPGWAYSCFVTALRRLQAAGASADVLANLETSANTVLDAFFPAYADDNELIRDVTHWLLCQMRQLRVLAAFERRVALGERPAAEQEPRDQQATQLHQRWTLRLRNSRRKDANLRVDRFALRLGLSALDVRWLLALLATETGVGVENTRRKWFKSDPEMTVGFLLKIITIGLGDEAAMSARLTINAPLVGLRCVHLRIAHQQGTSQAVRRCIPALDDSVIAFFEGRDTWPGEVNPLVEVMEPVPVVGKTFYEPQIEQLIKTFEMADQGQLHDVILCGYSLSAVRGLVRVFAQTLGRRVIWIHANWAFNEPVTFEALFRSILREARLKDAVVVVGAARQWGSRETAPGPERVLAAIRRARRHFPSPIVFDASLEGDPALRAGYSRCFEIRLRSPDFEQQIELWWEAVQLHGLKQPDKRKIARFVLDVALEPEDIFETVSEAHQQHAISSSQLGSETAEDSIPVELLRALANQRVQSGIRGLGEWVRTTFRWADLILPQEVLEKLMDVITYGRYRKKVFDDWGFASMLPYGKANTVLFTGPPGTGKTMVASLIGKELGLDLLRVDLSTVVSKYIGETEKNLARIFDEATRSRAALLFDEADSMFGKRTAVKSSHDRHANLEVNFMLQRIESFDGVTILTSNFPENIDDAFMRRIRFKVDFPFPDEDLRAKLWQVMLPREAKTGDDIDFEALGHTYELAGGSIKNAIVRAAFKAAELDTSIGMELLSKTACEEVREMGGLVRDGRTTTTTESAC